MNLEYDKNVHVILPSNICQVVTIRQRPFGGGSQEYCHGYWAKRSQYSHFFNHGAANHWLCVSRTVWHVDNAIAQTVAWYKAWNEGEDMYEFTKGQIYDFLKM